MNEELTDTIMREVQTDLDAIFRRLPIHRLDQYNTLQREFHSTDITADAKYQQTFADFYKLRGPQSFRDIYFSILDSEKSGSDLDFRRVLHLILERSKKVHASFTSKLLATIDPNLPVYDREVLIRLRCYSRYAGGSPAARLDRAVHRYQAIKEFHRLAKDHPIFPDLVSAFDRSFERFDHFTSTKKLDLMLWQSNRT